MTITPQQLREILQVFKDFEITDVKLKSAELELECRFPNSKSNQSSPRVPKIQSFPEAKYMSSIQSEITEQELEALGFAGVAPTNSPLNKA